LPAGVLLRADLTIENPGDMYAGNNEMHILFTIGTSDVEEEDMDAGASTLSIHPNPGSGITTFTYRLPRSGAVHLALYDIYGKLVAETRERGIAGTGSAQLDVSGLPSGIYTARLQGEGGVRLVRKLIVRR
jgi:hypothetical protein